MNQIAFSLGKIVVQEPKVTSRKYLEKDLTAYLDFIKGQGLVALVSKDNVDVAYQLHEDSKLCKDDKVVFKVENEERKRCIKILFNDKTPDNFLRDCCYFKYRPWTKVKGHITLDYKFVVVK